MRRCGGAAVRRCGGAAVSGFWSCAIHIKGSGPTVDSACARLPVRPPARSCLVRASFVRLQWFMCPERALHFQDVVSFFALCLAVNVVLVVLAVQRTVSAEKEKNT